MSAGSSSVTQPVSTLFMWMPSCVVVGGRRARHHVERGLGHVRVRMPRGLEPPVELPLDRRDVDDVLVALRRAQHQRLEPRVEDEGRDGVDELHLEQFDRRAPRPAAAARSSGRADPPAADPGRAGLRGTDRSATCCSSGSSGTCDSSAACVSRRPRGLRRDLDGDQRSQLRTSAGRRRADLVGAEQPAHFGRGLVRARAVSPAIMCS